MENIINIKKLSKSFKIKLRKSFIKDIFKPEYRIVHAVKSIDLVIKKGESVAILGPNGAGKTTLTKMICGLIYPSSGEISVLNFLPFQRKHEFLNKIGLVMGSRTGLHWDLTPEQNLEILRHIYKIEKEEFEKRKEKLIDILEVQKCLNIQVRNLSLGERMKFELIRSIIHNPDLLLLDEPTIGLDIVSKQIVRDFLREIQRKSSISILLTSHDTIDVERVCDRVVVINFGEKIFDDDINILLNRYKKKKIVKFLLDEKLNLLPDSKFKLCLQQNIEKEAKFEIDPDQIADLVKEVSKSNSIVDIDILSVSLETIIKELFETERKY